MADDIDELLDEVESIIERNGANNRGSKHLNVDYTPTKNLNPHGNIATGLGSLESDEIDELLKEDPPLPDYHKPVPSTNISTKKGVKCYPVLLGDCNTAIGLSSTTSQKACDKLRCLDCDFKVHSFDNFSWNAATDYYFLRNNMPEFQRIKSNLCCRNGSRAYGCQCKWRSVDGIIKVGLEMNLKWICSGH